MNGITPSIGITFDDKYCDAKKKLIDFVKALNDLTSEQREQLAGEFMMSAGAATSFEEFAAYMNARG